MTTIIPRNSVSFSEFLDHAQQESHRWHDWFNQHSQALDAPIDIAGSATVRDLLSHIVFVDLLFAEWLLGESITPAAIIDPARFTDRIDKTSPDAIFSVADSALQKWRKLLAKTSDEKWMSFPAPRKTRRPAAASALRTRSCTGRGIGRNSLPLCDAPVINRTGSTISSSVPQCSDSSVPVENRRGAPAE
jgi:uncharacterized damage-inducible protein DinB